MGPNRITLSPLRARWNTLQLFEATKNHYVRLLLTKYRLVLGAEQCTYCGRLDI